LVIKAQVFAQSETESRVSGRYYNVLLGVIISTARRAYLYSRDVIINYLAPPSPRPQHLRVTKSIWRRARAAHTHYPHPCRCRNNFARKSQYALSHYTCMYGRSQTATSERVFMHACMRSANKHTPAAIGLRVKFNIVRNVCIVGIPNGLLMAVTSTPLVKRDLNGATALTRR
jgi:hypothetical protein